MSKYRKEEERKKNIEEKNEDIFQEEILPGDFIVGSILSEALQHLYAAYSPHKQDPFQTDLRQGRAGFESRNESVEMAFYQSAKIPPPPSAPQFDDP